MFFRLRGIIQLVWCEMETVVNRGPATVPTSVAFSAKESPQVGSFILTYLNALFLVFKMFILGIKLSLKNEMWRGEDGPDLTEPLLSTGMASCLVFGRELVKFLSELGLWWHSVCVHLWHGTRHPAGRWLLIGKLCGKEEVWWSQSEAKLFWELVVLRMQERFGHFLQLQQT